MLAAPDGHAKNFSLFHEPGGRYRLTPFYDVLSAWPAIGSGPNKIDRLKLRMAMAVRSKNAHWKFDEIRPHHWNAVAALAGLGDAESLIAEIIAETEPAIGTVSQTLPKGFPDRVASSIFRGLRESAAALGSGTGGVPDP